VRCGGAVSGIKLILPGILNDSDSGRGCSNILNAVGFEGFGRDLEEHQGG